jgi:hypothetical protein
MRAEVTENAGADLRHDGQCLCRTCKRRRGMLDIPHPQPRHHATGRFVSAEEPFGGATRAPMEALSPADEVDGHSLWNLR